jgi:hypothetical protein
LPPNLQYADDFSSMATAALLQHAVQTLVLLPDRCAEAKRYGPKCTSGGFLAFRYPDDKTSRAPVRPEVVAGVVSSRQIHRHVSTKEHPHSGKHTFASPASCNIFREAIRPLWDNVLDAAIAAGGTLLPPPRTVRLEEGMKVAIVNRPTGNRNISNVDQLEAVLRAAFPGATVQIHVREHDKFAAQLRVFGEADVVIAAHGGALVGVPAMAPGSLLVEVFSWPMFQGTALSYFMRLGSNCGVTHRVYHEAVPGGRLQESHTWSLQSSPPGSVVMELGQSPLGGRGGRGTNAPKHVTVGHAIDPSQVVAMIREWQAAAQITGLSGGGGAGAVFSEDRIGEPGHGSEPCPRDPLPCKGASPNPVAVVPQRCSSSNWWTHAPVGEQLPRW